MSHFSLAFDATCWVLTATLALAGEAEGTVEELIDSAVRNAERGAHAEAIRLATLAIERDPKAAAAYKVRGRAHFCAGQLHDSVADFDQYVSLRPDVASQQWERGIACYYAGMYVAGAVQFESYQKFDGHDVENSVWRYLCLVPQVGVTRAQATMLPIENDRRVPMMQVFDLYRGQRKAEEVEAAARAGNPSEDVLAARLFYAHLYLGLWYEAQGDKQQAMRYITLSSDERLQANRGINRYMWEVARIHQRKLRGDLPAAKKDGEQKK